MLFAKVAWGQGRLLRKGRTLAEGRWRESTELCGPALGTPSLPQRVPVLCLAGHTPCPQTWPPERRREQCPAPP